MLNNILNKGINTYHNMSKNKDLEFKNIILIDENSSLKEKVANLKKEIEELKRKNEWLEFLDKLTASGYINILSKEKDKDGNIFFVCIYSSTASLDGTMICLRGPSTTRIPKAYIELKPIYPKDFNEEDIGKSIESYQLLIRDIYDMEINKGQGSILLKHILKLAKHSDKKIKKISGNISVRYIKDLYLDEDKQKAIRKDREENVYRIKYFFEKHGFKVHLNKNMELSAPGYVEKDLI